MITTKSFFTVALLVWTLSTINAQSDFCPTLSQLGLIFCDDFENTGPLSDRYFEINTNAGDFIALDNVGRDSSRGIRVKWQAGEVAAGGLSKSFGRTPSNYIGKNAAFPDSTFTEIYWRMDVRMQEGWQGGGPAKLSRALCMANANWATGAMAHLWSGGANDHFMGMDPASGIDVNGNLVSTKYNDFANLRWMGFKSGNIPLFNDAHAGRWFCVESHVKLNAVDATDGIFEFWINDTFQAGSYNLNWHGDWNANPANYGFNALFFENYWNAGSPVEQERYFDNLVISTQPIGCANAVSSTSNEKPKINYIQPTTQGFSYHLPSNESVILSIYSVQGQHVFSQNIQGSGFQNYPSVMIPGLWFYTIHQSHQLIESGKIHLP